MRPFRPRTIVEPFRIKSVETLPHVPGSRRQRALQDAHWNLFALDSADVFIDLLTDSGTGAMSAEQWAAIMRGDESYAGSPSFRRFEAAVRDLTGMPHVVPTHQGRAAEHLLFGLVAGPGSIVPSNTHFDTTRANVEATGSTALDLLLPAGRDPSVEHPFKGDMDVAALDRLLRESPGRVPVVMMTVTNNAGGGQPVSLANLRAVRETCSRHGVPLVLDACRFAENAWLVREREPGQQGRRPVDVAREMFSLADASTFSAKKDGLANIGGFLALRDDALAERARRALVLTEGFPTYGGLAGRDLEAIAVGLREVVEEDYLRYRHASVSYFGEALRRAGVPIVVPVGGHAVFVDGRRFCDHLEHDRFPAQSLSCALYLHAGIRSVEVGQLMFGRAAPGEAEAPVALDLVRLALPRRTYTQAHVDFCIEALTDLHAQRRAIPGLRIVEQPPVLRHFTAKLAPA